MIKYDNGGCLVEDVSELPNFARSKELFIDFETTSGNPKLKSTNPWFNCEIAGVCITADDCRNSFYVPFNSGLPLPKIKGWLRKMIETAESWINHNIKYDAHVFANCVGLKRPLPKLIDTLTLSKIIDSDRLTKGGYSLAALSRDWLDEDILEYEAKLKPYLHRNNDYGKIPPDVIGEYGCQDVLTARELWKYLQSKLPERCTGVWKTEIALTSILFEIERNGMRIDPLELKRTALLTLRKIIEIDEKLEAVTGRSFRPHVNADCFDVLCNQFGLPTLGETSTGNPSFDKKALAAYAVHPQAPSDLVDLIIQSRELNTFHGLFLEPYQHYNVNGFLHPTYNQAVTTGRMSCGEPNAQQLNTKAKRLIHPREGNSFISIDYSQIEFRIIVHYIQDRECIAAYEKDRRTDFHTWVAEMCEIPRKPAKTMNFMMGYGGGKKKAVATLAANKYVVGDLMGKVDTLVASGEVKESARLKVFNGLCKRKGEEVYERYHDTLPGLKRVSRKAASRAANRGFIYNLYGRHRHLPKQHAYKAFNALCQSSAADLMKERLVAVADMCKGTPIKLIANVHDEILFEAPTEIAKDRRTIRDLVSLMESPNVDLRVPICVDVGVSDKNWAEASTNASEPPYDPSCSYLEHLK